MNVDKIRFNHLPKGTKPPEVISNAIDFYIGYKTYVAVSSNTGLTKIGRSSNYENRVKNLERMYSDVLLIVAVFNDDREKRLHRKFNDKRVRGEWFSLTMQDVEYLKKESHMQ